MPWLNVPHQKQNKTGWCLPACVAMVTAYLEQPLLQDDIAHWLGTTWIGTPSSRIQQLSQRGFQVVYRTGSLGQVTEWLQRRLPCILFLRTQDLPYWKLDTPHAVALAGLEADQAYLFDPAVESAPMVVSVGDLMLAWSYSDYTYAALTT